MSHQASVGLRSVGHMFQLEIHWPGFGATYIIASQSDLESLILYFINKGVASGVKKTLHISINASVSSHESSDTTL